jgi:hypothetical protein
MRSIVTFSLITEIRANSAVITVSLLVLYLYWNTKASGGELGAIEDGLCLMILGKNTLRIKYRKVFN